MTNKDVEPLVYELDNTALIYPAIINKRTPMLFRLSATFTTIINVTQLQKALENILPRFPIMRTTLEKGLFWGYLKENFYRPKVQRDFFMGFNYSVTKKHNYPFCIKAYYYRIALETSHLVTDGKGAVEFFRSLIAEYLTLVFGAFDDYGSIIRPTTPFDLAEIEDNYQQELGISNVALASRKGRAFIEPSFHQPPPFFKIKRFTVDLDEIRLATKRYNVSLTEFLVALYTAAYQDRMFMLPPKAKYRRPIRITVPANLRTFMPSKTLRNFIGLINMEIDPRLGVYGLNEILQDTHHSFRKELTAKRFIPFISRNIRSERALVLASMPLVLKRPILKWVHANIMRQETSVLSNLGSIKFTPEIEKHIESIDFIPAAKAINRRDCAVISFKDQLMINFCRTCESDMVERFFYDRLCEEGVIPKVEQFSNLT